MALVEEEHDAQVAEAFVGEAGACDELEALDLAEMRGISEHVDVEQLRDIVVARVRVLLLERCPDGGRLFLDERALVRDGLAARSAAARGATYEARLARAYGLDERCGLRREHR